MCLWAIFKDAAMNTHIDAHPDACSFVKGSLKWNCWESSAVIDNATLFSKVIVPFCAHSSRENSYCSKFFQDLLLLNSLYVAKLIGK